MDHAFLVICFVGTDRLENANGQDELVRVPFVAVVFFSSSFVLGMMRGVGCRDGKESRFWFLLFERAT